MQSICTKLIATGARRFTHSQVKDTDVVVVSFARTPFGKFGGSLSTMTAPQVRLIYLNITVII